jgi:hypothetical protein
MMQKKDRIHRKIKDILKSIFSIICGIKYFAISPPVKQFEILSDMGIVSQ